MKLGQSTGLDWLHDVREPDDVRRSLVNPALAANAVLAREFVAGDGDVPVLLTMEGDQHRARRASVASAFSAQSVARSAGDVHDEALRLAKAVQAGRWWLGEVYVRPVAAAAVARFVGMEEADVHRLQSLGRVVLDRSRLVRRRTLAAAQLHREVVRLLPAARSAGGLVRVLHEHGAEEVDVAAALSTMLVVGTELGTRAVLGVFVAAESQDLRGVSCWTDAQLDRLLEQARVIPFLYRKANIDTSVGGVTVNTGEGVRLEICPVNGSNLVSSGRSVPFGFGPHLCLGAAWIRMLTREVLRAWVEVHDQWTVLQVHRPPPNTSPAGVIEVEVSVAS